jgi:hypothetical protein
MRHTLAATLLALALFRGGHKFFSTNWLMPMAMR